MGNIIAFFFIGIERYFKTTHATRWHLKPGLIPDNVVLETIIKVFPDIFIKTILTPYFDQCFSEHLIPDQVMGLTESIIDSFVGIIPVHQCKHRFGSIYDKIIFLSLIFCPKTGGPFIGFKQSPANGRNKSGESLF